MSSTIVFEQVSQMQRVCGVNDRNIPYIELLLNGELFVHGNSITYRDTTDREGSGDAIFTNLMVRLKHLSEQREDITEPEIFMEYQALQGGSGSQEDLDSNQREMTIAVGGKSIYPKSPRQRKYMSLMKEHQLVFSIGPAGTGKTFLAIAYALGEVLGGRKQKIILTRPVVEAGESLGFLPGDLTQKIGPYLRPLYDAMEFLLPPAIIKRLEDNGAVETAPLAYMRGRSLNNACVILDEAQNTTTEQMKMFLTRLSENSVAIVTGDITQVDLPRNRTSGLVHAAKILQNVPGIGFIEFNSTDVVRSRMVQRIIDAYEKDTYR
ncbi:PhoH family protein [Pleomorphochaeta sp. DL1XJH-081]|uniref:PhoH family protein n=1 Tax=Pleomorphochaeta sp. DL1XJH-081 TaxID=3409690 RepID=UPI003BB4E253